MAFGKLVNLFALSSLAVIVCSYGASPANALAASDHDLLKHKRALGHNNVAKKRRMHKKKRQDGTTQSCRPRSNSTPTFIQNAGNGTDASATPTDGSSDSASDSSASPSAVTETAAATSTTPASEIGGSGGGKQGLAWPNGDSDDLQNFVGPHTKYIYTWSETCPSQASSLGLTCMPMLWGNDPTREANFQKTVVQGYANIAMGFNEVNQVGQANIDVGTAVSVWQQYLQPLASQGYKLLAPVTTSAPDGFNWVTQFIEQCQGCTIDGITVHYYGTDPNAMIQYIQKWEGFKKPIWVTEFACQNFNTANENNGQQCSQDQVNTFYKTVVEYMESDSNVVAYFPFGYMHDMQGVNQLDQLMDGNNQPTQLAKNIMNLSF